MDGLKEKYDIVLQAIRSLEEVLDEITKKENINPRIYKMIRDSLIQRFEYTSELLWKYLRLYIEEVYKIPINAPIPNEVYKIAHDTGLLSKQELASAQKILQDRNLTSHIYREVIAQEIAADIPAHYQFMKIIAERLQPKFF
ncbi:MAG: Nucleotidyltransferase substrate binding protein, HI0074 family [candidate division TM6 bacterium GW2011_GWE2_41_16]|nr:MAG: Nucleotidyltransferase substrate binding protein, HI0074 family [candidate division TM6 bacterium GW2011_GWE2_41_16]